jgi:coenzyme F420-reducing hydrogenase delta subunit/ferredoxin
MKDRDRPGRVAAFLCNWCSYAGADLAGVSRLQYPTDIRIIRIPCSARMDPALVLRAYLRGADGVVVAGCHPGDCHYTTGNLHARRRISLLKRLLHHAGIEDGRFHLSWVSASEAQRFAALMRTVCEQVHELGPQERLARPKAETIDDPDLVVDDLGWPLEPARPPSPPAKPRPEAVDELRALARKLLESGEADVVLGWKESTHKHRPKPAFIRRPEDADSLILPEYGTVNLAGYLGRLNGKVAVAGRACDIRAAIQLTQEGQLNRDNLVFIGLGCAGILDPDRAAANPDGPRAEQLTTACLECPDRKPPVADHTISTIRTAEQYKPAPTSTGTETTTDSWEAYIKAFSRCIRCNACQRACPLCYCRRCFVERTPHIVEPGRQPVDNAMFHLVRAVHLAGRCVSCGACQRVCPVGLDPSWHSRRLAVDSEELFGHRAGTQLDGRSAVEEFNMDDTEAMVTEP